jgi:integrase
MRQEVTTTREPQSAVVDAGTIDLRLGRYAEMSKGAFSPNTLRAIASDTRIFAEWCADTRRAYLPTTPETVAAFIDAMSQRRKPATIARYVASIDHLHRAGDLPPPGAGNAARLALRRIRREKGTRQDQAKALRWTTIARTLELMGDALIDLRDAAILCLAYDTFARASEMIAFNVSDIACDIDGATAFIRASKTDQEGEGTDRFIARSTHARLTAWTRAARLERDGPLFIPLGGAAKNDRLSTGDISAIIARRCGGRYSAHSTRVGAAQDAMAAGATTAAIQQAGGWKSERMVLRYGGRIMAKESAAAMLAEVQRR